MKLEVILIIGFSLCGACKRNNATESKSANDSTISESTLTPIKYIAGGNDQATISLTLNPDNTSDFYFKLIDHDSAFRGKGSWKIVDKEIELVFVSTPKFKYRKVFSSGDSTERNIIVNDTTFRIPREKVITLWGIRCFRE